MQTLSTSHRPLAANLLHWWSAIDLFFCQVLHWFFFILRHRYSALPLLSPFLSYVFSSTFLLASASSVSFYLPVILLSKDLATIFPWVEFSKRQHEWMRFLHFCRRETGTSLNSNDSFKMDTNFYFLFINLKDTTKFLRLTFSIVIIFFLHWCNHFFLLSLSVFLCLYNFSFGCLMPYHIETFVLVRWAKWSNVEPGHDL